ncbi:MAG: lycopene cyclase family protein [Bacteroidetes bacterium]|nr:lycopene cyclase family protein [Bacteroidota bacterium]MDA0889380.1 lycopene cyclase family protein [Bacteroidota bacterium]MDA1085301.1 lycopene cyclase family protein [Bacteroidota bacterium]
MKKKAVYDYIFAGAGASTLQIIMQMLQHERFKNTSILILEENSTKTNDRTWCFWEEKSKEDWHPFVQCQWENITFTSDTAQLHEPITPYAYKMIRSNAFYTHMHELIGKNENIDLSYEKVKSFETQGEVVRVSTAKNTYTSSYFFNSILDWNTAQQQSKYPVLQQHFVGWFIKTKDDCFDPNTATFMDFSVAQKGNTRFMYVLPLSKNETLIEYTLFSEQLLNYAEYEREIRQYLTQKNIRNYSITETEQGTIPMTCYPFSKQNSKRVLHIGSAGGWTKASTGFTFKFIERKATELVDFLNDESDMRLFEKRTRFWWYDLLFLDVLAQHNHKGSFLFSRMFQRNNPRTILRFLDEKTTFSEEVRIMQSFPVGIFVWQLIRRLMRSLH